MRVVASAAFAVVFVALAAGLAQAALSGSASSSTPSQATAWAVEAPGTTSTSLVGVDVATNATVATIKLASSLGNNVGQYTPGELAIAPNGKTAYLAVEFSREVVPIDLTNQSIGTPIKVDNQPAAIAVTPNGSSLYVLGYVNTSHASVVAVNTSNRSAGKAIAVAPVESAHAGGIAITPNGQTVWVSSPEAGTISPISVSSGKVGPAITVGSYPSALAVTPNGQTLWVANSLDDDLVPVDLATLKAGKKVKLGGAPVALSITPNGAYALAALASPATGADRVQLSGSHAVQKLALLDPTNTPEQVDAVAVEPSGGTAFFGAAGERSITAEQVGTASSPHRTRRDQGSRVSQRSRSHPIRPRQRASARASPGARSPSTRVHPPRGSGRSLNTHGHSATERPLTLPARRRATPTARQEPIRSPSF